MPHRPTMNDVAAHVGVSRQLVSLVLRDLPGASPQTRERVLTAARELGYVPHQSARLLRGSRTRLLGVMFSMHEPFEVDIVEHLFGAARRHGHSLVLGPLSATRPRDDVTAELLGQRVEALLVLSAGEGEAVVEGSLGGIPVVQVGGPETTVPADDVRVDDAVGIELLVDHLAALGHGRVVHVSGGRGPNARSRRDAFELAMRARGLVPEVVEAAFSEDAGYSATTALLRRDHRPTAIMAANDRCAVGVLAALAHHGLRVPGDVSVTGFDDSSVASWAFTQLTTVDVDPAELAQASVDAALRRLADPCREPVRRTITPGIVVRTSTAAAPR